MNAKVLLVEDERDVKDLMLLHLKREGYDVVGVENGEEALRLLNSESFDIAVLDWMLPGVSGLELCKKIGGKMPVLMVTARADSADIVVGLEMGADDYITKPFEVSVFVARVRALIRRAMFAGAPKPEIYEVGGLRLNTSEHKVWCNDDEVGLTLSEFKLMVALLESRGKVLSRDRLIEYIQGEGIVVSDRTIDTHVFGLRKKLGDCADVVETIRGVGYRVRA